ncbi:low-density lipoprotein receptor-related protein 2-like isoform X1 [Argopecten irradians]|uniref:low-density lipoprotein receptor-related protein 2-like isoform X1 n=1 Tax=Argopecten irradians TaxID=31199 RepID=UPI003712BEFF
MVTTRFLICVCVVVGLACGEDTNGFFLLAGATGNTVHKLEHGSFSSINVSVDITTMAFDPLSRRVYYGYEFSIHLYSMGLDGTKVRMEATTDLYVQAIAIDSIAGDIFVYSPGHTGKIYRVRMGLEPTLDQSNIIHTEEREVFDLAVDSITGTLFWGSDHGVWQSSYNGTNKRNLLSESGYNHGITVDDDYVYVIKQHRIFKISRSQDLSLTEIVDMGSSTRADSLIILGKSLYIGISDCVYQPVSVCKSFIATVQTNGTGYRKVSPEVSSDSYGYDVTVVFVPNFDNNTAITKATTTAASTTGVAKETSVIPDGLFLLSTGDALYKLQNDSSSLIPTTTTSVDTIAYDPISERIYFGSVNSIYLYSMRLDGTDVREEATTDLYVQAIAIDSDAGNIFVYSPGYTGKIYRVRMGQEPTLDQSNIIHTDAKEVFFLAVDPKTRSLFWGSTSGVWQSNYDGTNKKILLSEPGYYDGIAVDDGNVYVIKHNRILKIERSMDNSVTEIHEVVGSSTAKSLAVDGNSLYFGVSECVNRPTTICNKSIATVQTDGAGLKYILPTVSSSNYGDSITLVYVNSPNVEMTATTTSTTTLAAGNPNGNTKTTVVNGQFLLAGAERNTLYILQDNEFIPVPVSIDIHSMAFDPLSRRVYCGSLYSIYLYSMKLDGTDVRMEATTELYAKAIAIDSVDGSIFVYSPGSMGNIYRISMGEDPTFDQSNIIHTNEMMVYQMAVDSKSRTLFWASTTGIWQSNYDGTNRQHLFSNYRHEFDKGGLAVDDSNVFAISGNKTFRIRRHRSLVHRFTEIHDTGYYSTPMSLVLRGDNLYFGITSSPDMWKSSIATMKTDGTGYRRISPVLTSTMNYGYRLTLVDIAESPDTNDAISSTGAPTRLTDLGIALIISILVLLVITISFYVCLGKKYRSSGKFPKVQGKSHAIYTTPNVESSRAPDTESHTYDELTCNVYEVLKCPSEVDFKFDANNQKQNLEKMYREMDAKTPNHMPDGKQWYTNQDIY